MAALDIITLDTATPQLEVPQTGDTYNAPRAIAIAPEGLTGSAATPSLDVAQTWNTTGTPTALKLNVTDTASNAASLLMDLQVGGASKFSVSPTGSASALALISSAVIRNLSGLYSDNSSIRTAETGYVGWSSSGGAFNAPDLFLYRDAANTLAQRNSTNAQTFRVYNTFTDGSNYEFGSLSWAANELYLQTAAAGTGTNRNIVIRTGGGIKFQTSSADRWQINTSGHFITAVDNTVDIGASGATRPRFLYLGGGSLTGSAADSSLTISPTWNTTGTPTALKLNVTDTASNAASLLMDLQVGGVSKASVTKSGRFASGRGYVFAEPQFYDSSIGSGAGFQIAGGTACVIYGNGSATLAVDSSAVNGVRIAGDLPLSWVNGHAIATVSDLRLYRDAANTLAQRNSTNAQAFRLYGTYTDASNYERGKIEWASNVLRIGTEKAGTGTARALELQTDGTTRLTIGTTGDFLYSYPNSTNGFMVENAEPIGGASGASVNLYTTGAPTGGDQRLGQFLFGSTSGGFRNSASISAFSAASWALGTSHPTYVAFFTTPSGSTTRAERLRVTADGLVAFGGGGTSSFPALKRSSTALQVRLADDSAFAPLAAAAITANAGTAIPAGGTQGAGLKVSSTADFGVFFGSGAPTLTAAKGSLYLRSDGSTTNDRMYVNTDGATTWTAVTTAA